MIAAFNQLGEPTPKPPTTTTTTAPPLAPRSVSVDVLNASGAGLLATDTAEGLRSDGFTITGIDNAPSVIPSGEPSRIYYGPTGLAAARTLADSLSGRVIDVPDPELTGNDLTLWVASAALRVTTTTTTTTTVPGSPTTPTTIPSDVYTNTEPEPWNPVPCTLGSPGPTTTTSRPKGRTGTAPKAKIAASKGSG